MHSRRRKKVRCEIEAPASWMEEVIHTSPPLHQASHAFSIVSFTCVACGCCVFFLAFAKKISVTMVKKKISETKSSQTEEGGKRGLSSQHTSALLTFL